MNREFHSPVKYIPEDEGSCGSSSTSGIGDMGAAMSSVQKDNLEEEKVTSPPKPQEKLTPPKPEEIKNYVVLIPNPGGGTNTSCRPPPNRRKSKPYKSGIGRSTADKLQSLSWLWNEKVDLMECFKDVMSANEKVAEGMKPMSSKDLQEVLSITPGEFASGIVTYVKDPSEFFVVLEKMEIYCLDNPVWKEFFPCFQTGPEAHRGLIQLLNVFYKLSTSLGDLTNLLYPEIGSLVALKLSRNRKKEQDVSNKKTTEPDLVHQMRRGMIVDVVNDTKRNQTLYRVYLLDYGFEVTVSTDCLYPLYKPFNCIAPLAVKCGLFGVSPVGENWNGIAVTHVKHMLQKYSTATLAMQFYSSTNYISLESPTLKLYASSSHIVNMEVHKFNLKTGQVEFVTNFAEDLVNEMLGIPWNLTPSRPKLMEGTDIPPVEIKGTKPGTRLTISMRDGLFLTDFHPRVYQPLSAQVLKREVEKLFRLRGVDMCDVLGMHNRLVIFLEDPNGDLQKPSTITSSWKNEGAEKESGETQNKECLTPAEDEKPSSSNVPVPV